MEAPGAPHEALFLVLAYLPLRQLLSMSQASKSFREAISNDVLIWLDLVVEKPLSSRLTNDILMRITSKAHGRLRTLALLSCFKITDDCLMRVVCANPSLTKLYLPACTGLTPGMILEGAKMLTALRNVKINGIYNIEEDHLQGLQHQVPETTERKSRFYHKYRISNFQRLDEDCSSIDVQVCPKCKDVKVVFDCPWEACRAKKNVASECRGCDSCIRRCEGCGRCITNEDDEELGETVCNDALCLDCWLGLPKCSFCNKSYCPRHVDEQLTSPYFGSFVCDICEMKYPGDI